MPSGAAWFWIGLASLVSFVVIAQPKPVSKAEAATWAERHYLNLSLHQSYTEDAGTPICPDMTRDEDGVTITGNGDCGLLREDVTTNVATTLRWTGNLKYWEWGDAWCFELRRVVSAQSTGQGRAAQELTGQQCWTLNRSVLRSEVQQGKYPMQGPDRFFP